MRNNHFFINCLIKISLAATVYAHTGHYHQKAIGGLSTEILQRQCRKERRYVEPTTTFNYYDDPKDNLAFERCIEVMSRLMMKYGPALLEKMEREKLEALIQAEIEPVADNGRFSKRLLGYCQLMKGRK